MDDDRIDDLIQRGRGIAAWRVGALHTLHRPRTPLGPLASGTATMSLPALFAPSSGRAALFGHPLFEATVDAAYTQPGDYLVGPRLTWFIADQSPLLPVLCVRANRLLDILRPPNNQMVGLAAYGGLRRDTASIVLSGWPASVLTHGYGLDRAELPADAPLGGWSVLLPRLPGAVAPRTGDLLTDDFARSAVVSAAEPTEMGWRLSVRQTAT